MSELLKIQQYLAGRGLDFVTPRLISPTSGAVVLEVARDRIQGAASSGNTSRRQLSFLSKTLEAKFGRKVLITIRDAQSLDDVAASLRAVMKREFPDAVTDVHVSFEDANTAAVWIESASRLEAVVLEAARLTASRALAEFEVACKSFDVVAPPRPEPSTMAILRSIKVLAPVPTGRLEEDLDRRGFACPSEKWLSHKLDTARKRGLVWRDPNGRFSLTAEGLSVVPISRSGSSSDVERMLAVARRKEYVEQEIERRIRALLGSLELKAPFRPARVGDDEVYVKFPLVQQRGASVAKIIKPFNLNQAEPMGIYDHGGTWLQRIQRLRKRNLLPHNVLFAVRGPDQDDLKRFAAFEAICGELRLQDVLTVAEDAQERIAQFATG